MGLIYFWFDFYKWEQAPFLSSGCEDEFLLTKNPQIFEKTLEWVKFQQNPSIL